VSDAPGRRLPRVGALDRWLAEIDAATRQNTAACYDSTAAAAGWESLVEERETVGDLRTAREYLDLALLHLRGHWVPLQDLHTDATKKLLQSLRGESRTMDRRRRASWIERNAAMAAEYAL
jgi:hypothetical protein